MTIPITRRGIATLAAAGSLLLVALAVAPHADAAEIFACVKKKGGAVRIVTKSTKCKKTEKKLTWNVIGPAGKKGADGKNGANGTSGTNGKEGAPGQPQKAVTFNTTLSAAFEAPPSAPLFINLGGVSANLVCFSFIVNFSIIEAVAPAGSHAETGLIITNSEGGPPKTTQEAVKDTEVTPSPTSIAKVASNTAEPFANIGHLNGSIATPTSTVLFDMFVRAGANPGGCVVRGTAFTIPL